MLGYFLSKASELLNDATSNWQKIQTMLDWIGLGWVRSSCGKFLGAARYLILCSACMQLLQTLRWSGFADLGGRLEGSHHSIIVFCNSSVL